MVLKESYFSPWWSFILFCSPCVVHHCCMERFESTRCFTHSLHTQSRASTSEATLFSFDPEGLATMETNDAVRTCSRQWTVRGTEDWNSGIASEALSETCQTHLNLIAGDYTQAIKLSCQELDDNFECLYI